MFSPPFASTDARRLIFPSRRTRLGIQQPYGASCISTINFHPYTPRRDLFRRHPSRDLSMRDRSNKPRDGPRRHSIFFRPRSDDYLNKKRRTNHVIPTSNRVSVISRSLGTWIAREDETSDKGGNWVLAAAAWHAASGVGLERVSQRKMNETKSLRTQKCL